MIKENNVFHIGDKVKIKDCKFEYGEIVDVAKSNKITDEVSEMRRYRVKVNNYVIFENVPNCRLEPCKDGDLD